MSNSPNDKYLTLANAALSNCLFATITDCNQAIQQVARAIEEAEQRGRQQASDCIVAYLRQRSQIYSNPYVVDQFRLTAEEIEAGLHLKGLEK